LHRVASSRHKLRKPRFYWVSRWRAATPRNPTQPLRTGKLAKNWPSIWRRQAALRVFPRPPFGYVETWRRALCSSCTYLLPGCAEITVQRGHV
jgi:hypothetical protein